MLLFIACLALIVGIMLDAIDFLPFMVLLLSVLAFLSAIFLMMAYGTDMMLLAMVMMGSIGMATTWRDIEPI